MKNEPNRLGVVALVLALAACAAPPPPPVADAGPQHFDPAPMPFVAVRRVGRPVGALELPIPPKMPLGTGAVPVSNSSVRGSIVTGFHEAF